jgi:hypothetical protein
MVVALLLALVLQAGTAATPSRVRAETLCEASGEGRNVDSAYFAELLMMLQQKPHPFAVKALMDWKPMEGTRACWNPLSTTMQTDNSQNFNCLNPPECTTGVQDFPNKVKGQQATSRTLALSFYGAMRNFLAAKSFDPEELRESIYIWGGDDAYATELIDRWQTTWQSRRPEGLKPPTGVTTTTEAANVVVTWRGTRQGQQATTVWRWEGDAWSRIGRVGANVTEFVDRSPLPKGKGSYLVCAEGSHDSACSEKSVPASRASSVATKVNVTSFPGPTHRGASVFIRAVTSPGATCSLSNRPGFKAKASSEQTADSTGAVTWKWAVAMDTPAGRYSIKVTCGAASVEKSLVIE